VADTANLPPLESSLPQITNTSLQNVLPSLQVSYKALGQLAFAWLVSFSLSTAKSVSGKASRVCLCVGGEEFSVSICISFWF